MRKKQQLNSKLVNINILIIEAIYEFAKEFKKTKKKSICKINCLKLI